VRLQQYSIRECEWNVFTIFYVSRQIPINLCAGYYYGKELSFKFGQIRLSGFHTLIKFLYLFQSVAVGALLVVVWQVIITCQNTTNK
jgi:hypothetical protein